MFNEHRELNIENTSLVRLNTSKLTVSPGSAPTDGVGNELFVKGLENTLGTKAVKAFPMPPSVARALEREFENLFAGSSGVVARYGAAAAILANLQLYSNFLRGNEPWKQKLEPFLRQPYLDVACPQCGRMHAFLTIEEMTKTSNRGFDLVLATPVTGAGLHSARAVLRMQRMAIEMHRLLAARGIKHDGYLYVKENGKPWQNQDFWKAYVMPALRRLQVQGHPGLVGLDLGNARKAIIRMYRRGGEKFVLQAGVPQDLVDLMGRWRPKQAQSEPSIMRQRYYEMECEDGWTVTGTAPPRSHLGFAAWYPFER